MAPTLGGAVGTLRSYLAAAPSPNILTPAGHSAPLLHWPTQRARPTGGTPPTRPPTLFTLTLCFHFRPFPHPVLPYLCLAAPLLEATQPSLSFLRGLT